MLLIYRIRRSTFVTNVITLASGALLAKAITVLCSPILTRLYSPADFGMMAVFMAVVSSVSPAVCGKYEVAMVLPKSHRQGEHLLGISLRVAIAISLIFLLVVIFFNDYLLALLNAEQLGKWIFIAPVALLLTGIMTAMRYFANRHKDYGKMAKISILNSLVVAISSIIFGLFDAGFAGMLVSFIIGMICSISCLYFIYRPKLPSDLMRWGENKTALIRRYIDYPIYNASTGLLDGFTAGMPIFFLIYYYPESIVGYYAVIKRVAQTPLSFIATSVSQVNLKKIAELNNAGISAKPYLFKATIGLVCLVFLPAALLFLYSPEIFTFVFGEEWQEAGVYMQILVPALAIKFIVSTLSSAFGATQKNRIAAIWKVIAFIVTMIVLSIFAPRQNPVFLFQAIAAMDILLYLFYYFLMLKAVEKPVSFTD